MIHFDSLAPRLAGSAGTLVLALLLGCNGTDRGTSVVAKTPAAGSDSDLVESGPPAVITGQGIRLIHNSRNEPAIGDKKLPGGTYSAAQALFEKNDLSKLLKRINNYFMRPEKPCETTGQANQVVFIEGLVRFKSKWFLYHGTADSKIAVASRP